MLKTPSIPKPRETTGLWLYKILAGAMVVILLGVHFVVNHLVAPGGLLSYADVVRYYQVPFVPVMEIAFLFFVVSHALVGLRSILLDMNPSAGLLRIMDIVFIVAGVAFVIYGTWLVIVIAQRPI